jgi:hypothetical protein
MALTTDFSFQLGTSGFILNDGSATAYPTVDILEIQGLDSAPVRTTVKDREGYDGGYVDAEFDQARTIVLSGVLYDDCDHTEVTLDTLKKEWAPSKVPVALYLRFPQVGTRMLWVKPVGVNYSLSQLRRLGICEITFTAIAGDPRIYAAFETTKSMDVTNVVQTGYGYNKSYNYGYGGVTPNSFAINVVNAGNRPTPAKFRMFGPYINPHIKVSNSAGDFEMAFDMIVDSTSYYLEVDTAARTVRFHGLFGAQNRRDTLRRPSWFDLQPGNNYVSFDIEGGGAFGTRMDVIYRSAWR